VFNEAMSPPTLTRHGVRFQGPALTRRTRDALTRAGVSLLERSAVPEWNGQVVEYLVVLPAATPESAIGRVREIVSRDGNYGEFAPDPA
jgi:hypothetical protein